MIEKYRLVPYGKRGRTIQDGLDCWGLVRLIRMDLGYSELPLFNGVDPLDKRLFTQSASSCIELCELVKSDIKQGAIACGYKGRLCYHVGIVLNINGKMMIAETDENTGVVLTSISNFESRYSRVEYYD